MHKRLCDHLAGVVYVCMRGKDEKFIQQLADAVETGVDLKGSHGHKNISKCVRALGGARRTSGSIYL